VERRDVLAAAAGSIAIIVSSVVAVGCTVLGAFLGGKLNKIHVLVNSRLTEALEEIAKLKKERAENEPED
jgi:hypothetical protein